MSDLKDFVIENGILKRYNGEDGCVVIPDGVTTIGKDAFACCFHITSITIPDSVTSIGNDAVYECTSLTSITIPKNVTSIGNSAFKGCINLTNVTISSGVKKNSYFCI